MPTQDRSREYFWSVLPLPVCYFDAMGRLLDCNRAGARMLGLAEEQLSGRSVDDLRIRNAALFEVLAQGLSAGTEGSVFVAPGVWARVTPDRDASGALRGVLLYGMPPSGGVIDPRLSNRVLDSLFVFVSVLSPEGIRLQTNESALRVAGLRHEDVLGKPFAETACWANAPAKMRDQIRRAVERAAAGECVRFDAVCITGSGEGRPVDVMIAPLREDTGEITHLVATGIDISERQRKEQALRESREDLKHAQAVAHVGSWRMNVRRNELRWSDEAHHMFGIPVGTPLTYESFLAAIHPDDRERVNQAWQAALRGAPYDIEHRILAGGELKWVRERAELEFDGNGELLGGFGTVQDITALKQAEEALRESEDRFHTLADNIAQLAWMADCDGTLVWFNKRWFDYTGTTPEQMTDSGWQALLHPDHLQRVVDRLRQCFLSGEAWEDTFPLRSASGDYGWFLAQAIPIRNASGRVVRWFGTSTDITDLRSAEQKLRASRDFVEKIMASVASAVFVLDATGMIARLNPAASTVSGYAESELVGRRASVLLDQERQTAARERFEHLLRDGIPLTDVEVAIRRKDGALRTLVVNASKVRADDADFVVAAAQDITERKRMEEQIRHLAHHDPLTGLPNRRLFFELVSNALQHVQRSSQRLALLFLDLDRFKEVNDRLGHDAGDRLLVQVAERLQRKLRRSDTVARVGGDEFIILLTGISRGESAADVAEQIIDAFQQPFVLAGTPQKVTVSVGIGVYPEDGSDVESLMARADLAMYEAKARGRNIFHFFDAQIDARALYRVNLEHELRHALRANQLELFYQPQVHITTGELVALEALVRWRHPRRGLLAPEKFMSVAEESGLSLPLERWVLHTACAQMRDWQRRGAVPARVSVNVSTRQFHAPDLVDIARGALASADVAPGFLELEVGEETVMGDVEYSASRLQHLASVGVQLSVDDFGTGRTSLSWLQRLPIRRVKVDRALIGGLRHDGHELTTVQAVISLSHSLRLGVVAEGVETAEQLSLLSESGCDDAQGFFIEVPLPASGIERRLFAL